MLLMTALNLSKAIDKTENRLAYYAHQRGSDSDVTVHKMQIDVIEHGSVVGVGRRLCRWRLSCLHTALLFVCLRSGTGSAVHFQVAMSTDVFFATSMLTMAVSSQAVNFGRIICAKANKFRQKQELSYIVIQDQQRYGSLDD